MEETSSKYLVLSKLLPATLISRAATSVKTPPLLPHLLHIHGHLLHPRLHVLHDPVLLHLVPINNLPSFTGDALLDCCINILLGGVDDILFVDLGLDRAGIIGG